MELHHGVVVCYYFVVDFLFAHAYHYVVLVVGMLIIPVRDARKL